MAPSTFEADDGVAVKIFFECVFVCMMLVLAYDRSEITDLNKQVTELETKLYASRIAEEQIERRTKWPPKHIGNYHAVYAASEETGVPIELLSAIAKVENGPMGLEMGNMKLPSVAYQRHYPTEYWNYLAGGHTIATYANKYVWEKDREKFLTYLSENWEPKNSKKWKKLVKRLSK